MFNLEHGWALQLMPEALRQAVEELLPNFPRTTAKIISGQQSPGQQGIFADRRLPRVALPLGPRPKPRSRTSVARRQIGTFADDCPMPFIQCVDGGEVPGTAYEGRVRFASAWPAIEEGQRLYVSRQILQLRLNLRKPVGCDPDALLQVPEAVLKKEAAELGSQSRSLHGQIKHQDSPMTIPQPFPSLRRVTPAQRDSPAFRG